MEREPQLREEPITNITQEVLGKLLEKNILPTIKVIFYDKEGNVSFYLSDKKKHEKRTIANLVGGGIQAEEGEDAVEALGRELAEELDDAGFESVPTESLSSLPVLAFGTAPTSKQKWNAKGIFLTAMEVPSVRAITPRKGELRGPEIFENVTKAIDWLYRETDNLNETVSIYRTGLEELGGRFSGSV